MKALAAGLALLAFAPIAGAAEKPVLTAERSDIRPRWAPDGKHIAFVRYTDRASSVYVVQSSGRVLRRVRIRSGSADAPAWSWDGKRLAIVHRLPGPAGRSFIEIARSDGRVIRRLTEGGSPVWSPNGKWISFERGFRIWRVPSRGGHAKRLTVQTLETYPGLTPSDWSPDGRKLAITMGGNRVAVVPANGGYGILIGLGRSPTWSPDGRTLAVACLYARGIMFFTPDRAQGGCASSLLDASTGRPEWAADGQQVAYSACYFEDCRIFVRRRTESQATALTEGVTPSWSPSGTSIVFARRIEGGQYRLYLMDADGSNVKRLPLLPT